MFQNGYRYLGDNVLAEGPNAAVTVPDIIIKIHVFNKERTMDCSTRKLKYQNIFRTLTAIYSNIYIYIP